MPTRSSTTCRSSPPHSKRCAKFAGRMTFAASTYPIADPGAANALGRLLRNVGYTDDAIYRLPGDDAYSTDREDAPVEARRLPKSRLALLVRVFFLQLPVSRAEAIRALGPQGLEAVEATGLAEIGVEFVPLARILPIGRVLLA